MNLNDLNPLHAAISAARHATRNQRQFTLGQLIDALKQRPQDQDVYFDFCGFMPCGTHSYRGYYEDLAIGFVSTEQQREPHKVSDLLAELHEAAGATFQGYKGGDFTMTRDTLVWVANYGESGGTGIVGVIGRHTTIIETAHCDTY